MIDGVIETRKYECFGGTRYLPLQSRRISSFLKREAADSSTKLHGVTSQKIVILILITVQPQIARIEPFLWYSTEVPSSVHRNG
jgi:hypothetical protein